MPRPCPRCYGVREEDRIERYADGQEGPCQRCRAPAAAAELSRRLANRIDEIAALERRIAASRAVLEIL